VGEVEVVVGENDAGDGVDDGLLELPLGDGAVGLGDAQPGGGGAEAEIAEEGLPAGNAGEGVVGGGAGGEGAAGGGGGGAERVGEAPGEESGEPEIVGVGERLRGRGADAGGEVAQLGVLVLAVAVGGGDLGIEDAELLEDAGPRDGDAERIAADGIIGGEGAVDGVVEREFLRGGRREGRERAGEGKGEETRKRRHEGAGWTRGFAAFVPAFAAVAKTWGARGKNFPGRGGREGALAGGIGASQKWEGRRA